MCILHCTYMLYNCALCYYYYSTYENPQYITLKIRRLTCRNSLDNHQSSFFEFTVSPFFLTYILTSLYFSSDYECATSCTLCLAHLGSHKLKASREYAGGLASLVINPNMFCDVISIITDIAKVNRKHATIHRTIDSC